MSEFGDSELEPIEPTVEVDPIKAALVKQAIQRDPASRDYKGAFLS